MNLRDRASAGRPAGVRRGRKAESNLTYWEKRHIGRKRAALDGRRESNVENTSGRPEGEDTI